MSSVSVPTDSSITDRYRSLTPGSAALSREAASLFPSGVTHDSRYTQPYGIYVERAEGALKWDVDGNEYVDYFGGHGSLLLGHAHPEVTQAIRDGAANSTHFAAGHAVEVRWGGLVKQLIPSAERVRFTSSGSEANAMAVRLARASTGRCKVLRFRDHFHGWLDEFATGFKGEFDGTTPVGVPASVADNVVLCTAGDLDQVASALAADADIAAVMLEPLGAATGAVPIKTSFLEGLRELTAAHGSLLIFDEVVTGFRITRGGVQAATGVTPDITTLAKILAGGLPGGAVTGRADIMEWLDFEVSEAGEREKIYHPGTYNANPLSASAGATALQIIASTDVSRRASDLGKMLRDALTEVLVELQVPWGVYGEHSVALMFLNPRGRDIRPTDFDAHEIDALELKSAPTTLVESLKLAMLANGVDLAGWPGALVSGAHDHTHIDRTADAFRESLLMLRHDRLL